ncbi:hypothetical protein [Erwinia psidii]|uniref:Uncharacterized protein n=1 Tax=Erwinia psidii TaxID=69224 RepID=A0A3N6S0U6_9GAMM|nr:hypothetical protein [Erwinia psidii]RQM39144.1 hypothetical protein EB241_05145 [Erwinia psidii]
MSKTTNYVVPYIPSTGWDILKLNTPRIIAINFDHSEPVPAGTFSGLNLEQAKQLLVDLQMHVDYLDKLGEK